MVGKCGKTYSTRQVRELLGITEPQLKNLLRKKKGKRMAKLDFEAEGTGNPRVITQSDFKKLTAYFQAIKALSTARAALRD